MAEEGREGEAEQLEGRGRRVVGSVREEGEFHNNMLHGTGVRQTATNTYEGQFVRGVRHGTGVCTIHANGFRYEGDWVNDKIVRGKLRFKEQGEEEWVTFEGAFENVSPVHGKLTYANGNVYEGGVKSRCPDGQGTMKYSDGSIYEGRFWLGRRDGKGTMLYSNGEVQLWKFFEGRPRYFSPNCQPYTAIALLYVFCFLLLTSLGYVRFSLGLVVLNTLPLCHLVIVWILQRYILETRT